MDRKGEAQAPAFDELLGGSVVAATLRLFWFLSVAVVILGVLPCTPAAYKPLLRKLAGRGKLRMVERDENKNVGPLMRLWAATIPQAWFSHFYLVGFLTTLILIQHMFFPNFFIFWHLDSTKPVPKPFAPGFVHAESIVLLTLMLIHVTRRLCESTMLEKHAPESRMHVATYGYGLCYYVAAPLTLYVHRSKVVRSVWGLFSVHQLLGALIFLYANIKQHQCGRILARLRHRTGPFDRIPRYKVPRGDWFEWVACPHYLAEILLYLGLVIVSGGEDLTIWLMFSWVVANLAYAAKLARSWYAAKLEDFPKERKALIPLLF